jgi:glutathione peroxidase
MIKSFLLTALFFGLLAATQPTKPVSFYDFKMKSIDGKEIDFKQYKGKKVLLVNVASKCGYTPQYKDLEALHEQHGKDVVVLGFPANNFGSQEPGTNAEIKEFCSATFGVKFQMFEKISVKGEDAHPLYKWLAEKGGSEPKWNFSKYLVNEKGEVVKYWPSSVKPLSEEVLAAIKK